MYFVLFHKIQNNNKLSILFYYFLFLCCYYFGNECNGHKQMEMKATVLQRVRPESCKELSSAATQWN